VVPKKTGKRLNHKRLVERGRGVQLGVGGGYADSGFQGCAVQREGMGIMNRGVGTLRMKVVGVQERETPRLKLES